MNLTTYHYSLVRYVPHIARGEAANLGVIVVDDARQVAGSAFLRSARDKVTALAPRANITFIDAEVARLARRATCAGKGEASSEEVGKIRASAQLRTLAGAMKNQIQLSEPRPYRAASLDAAVATLFRELVLPVGAVADSEAAADDTAAAALLRPAV